MPKIRRHNLPPDLLEHLADRVRLREISSADLIALRDWLDTNPEVTTGPWFKRFENFFLCGNHEFIKTVLSKQQCPIGKEVL